MTLVSPFSDRLMIRGIKLFEMDAATHNWVCHLGEEAVCGFQEVGGAGWVNGRVRGEGGGWVEV